MTDPSPAPGEESDDGPPESPERFTPPHAEPASSRAVRSNLIIASVLAGGGCLLVALAALALVFI